MSPAMMSPLTVLCGRLAPADVSLGSGVAGVPGPAARSPTKVVLPTALFVPVNSVVSSSATGASVVGVTSIVVWASGELRLLDAAPSLAWMSTERWVAFGVF